MRRLFGIGVLGTAVILAVAFSSAAVASTLTSPEGTTYTGEIVATSTNLKFSGSFVTWECGHSELKAQVEQHGAVNAGGKVKSWTFTECNYVTSLLKGGSLEVTSANAVVSKGTELTINTSVGDCIFTTNATTGTAVGTLTEGSNASWDINSVKIPRTGGNFLCGSSGTWSGSYAFTTPSSLWVD